MKQIQLNKGMVALVDDDYYDFLTQWSWFAYRSKKTHIWYARRTTHYDGKVGYEMMHRIITRAKRGIRIDHRDGNGLNNQRCNLRFATVSQNGMNRSPNRTNGTGIKGVYKSVSRRGVVRFHAHVKCNGNHYYLGIFDDAATASAAYNDKASDLFGEFARLNPV